MLNVLLYCCVISVICYYIYLNVHLYKVRKQYWHIPSLYIPLTPWWLLGHLPYISRKIKKEKSFFTVLRELHEDVNSIELIVYHIFNRNIIVCTDLELVGAFLTDHTTFKKHQDIHKILSYIDGNRIFGPYGIINEPGTDVWRKKRKMMDPAFHRTFLRTIVDQMNDISVRLSEHLRTKPPNFDISSTLCIGALEMICKCGFDLDMGEDLISSEESAYIKAATNVLKSIQNVFNYRFTYNLPWMFRKDKKILKHSVNLIRTTMKAHLEKRLREDRDEEDILSYIIKGNQWSDDFTIENIVDDFLVFFGAGMETTGHAMSFFMFYVMKNKHVLCKLRAEIDSVYSNKAVLTYDDLNKLTYMDQTIKEVLRLKPPVEATGRQNMAHDVNVCGTSIPHGAFILLPTVIMHTSPQYWDDPLTFDPERFGAGAKIKPFTYMPFMVGPRSCIGKNFAILEMKIILSRLIRDFDLVDPQPGVKELVTNMNITTRPSNGVFVTLLHRQHCLDENTA